MLQKQYTNTHFSITASFMSHPQPSQSFTGRIVPFIAMGGFSPLGTEFLRLSSSLNGGKNLVCKCIRQLYSLLIWSMLHRHPQSCTYYEQQRSGLRYHPRHNRASRSHQSCPKGKKKKKDREIEMQKPKPSYYDYITKFTLQTTSLWLINLKWPWISMRDLPNLQTT